MIKINYKWDETNYLKFIEYLKKIGDEKTKAFNKKICNSNYEFIGIKMPVLKSIAKDINNRNPFEFLEKCKSKYYEEVMIEGLVIGNIKDEDLFAKYLNKYIYKIDSWALCDSCISNAKILGKSDFSDLAYSYILDTREYIIRVGYIILLNYYINDEHIDTILELCKKESDYYYVNMAISWLISECFVKYKAKTLELLKTRKLNTFVQNKAISKIRESYRVSKEDKEIVNKLKK